MTTKDQIAELIDVMLGTAVRSGEAAGMAPAEVLELFVQRAAEKNIELRGYADTYDLLVKLARRGIREAADELAAPRH